MFPRISPCKHIVSAAALSALALKFKLEETKRNSEKLIDTLKAVLEETDIRIADLKKEAYEFKRDIVVGAENMRTGNTMAEKVKRSYRMNGGKSTCNNLIADVAVACHR